VLFVIIQLGGYFRATTLKPSNMPVDYLTVGLPEPLDSHHNSMINS